ncbi:(2Fe-2S)-binding protein [Pseudomonadales bacterium]|nr:(2Fe-2S)-binding protein [Pseudomonadales bacterium]
MAKYELMINGEAAVIEAAADMPLLWALRDLQGLTGTKYGCGIGQCGACTVHVNSAPTRSCLLPLSAAAGASVTTIEGLADGGQLSAVQKVWIETDVAQCGYCQAGQIMSATALLNVNPSPSDEDIDQAMSGNYCRCGTYIRIREAVHAAAAYYNAGDKA